MMKGKISKQKRTYFEHSYPTLALEASFLRPETTDMPSKAPFYDCTADDQPYQYFQRGTYADQKL